MYFLFLLYKTSKTAILPLTGPTRVQQSAVPPQPHCLRKAREMNQKRRQPDISSQSSSSQGINGPSYQQGLSPICLFLVRFLYDWASDWHFPQT